MTHFFSDFLNLGILRLFARILLIFRFVFIVWYFSPSELGDYTKLLLLVFYFGMAEGGILNELERLLPHHMGSDDAGRFQTVANTGWSAYFILSGVGAVLLAAFCGWKGDWHLGLLLGMYLFVDKWYRAYESYARSRFDFISSGIGSVLTSLVSLAGVILLLPKFRVDGIFYAMILGALAAGALLCFKHPLRFRFHFHFNKLKQFFIQAIPFASTSYSSEFFNNVGLTVLAFYLSKEAFGHYAFAFRILQTFMALFPYVMKESMRSKIFFHVARTPDNRERIKVLIEPAKTYGLLCAGIFLTVYCWIPWGIQRFFVQYSDSVMISQILTLSLLPVGLANLFSDFASSQVFGETFKISIIWILVSALHAGALIIFGQISPLSLTWAANLHVITSFAVCVSLGYWVLLKGYSFLVSSLKQFEIFLTTFFAIFAVFMGNLLSHHPALAISFMSSLISFGISLAVFIFLFLGWFFFSSKILVRFS